MELETQKTKHKTRNMKHGTYHASCFMLHASGEKGQALMTVVIFTLFISLGGLLGFSSIALNETRTSRETLRAEKSYYLSEAGAEDVTYRIFRGKQYSAIELLSLNGFYATTTVSNVGDTKEVIAVGDVENGIRNVKTILEKGVVNVSFFYGVQVGYLGLKMENESQIIGNVYSNGNIEGKNDPVITGDAWVARGTASSSDQEQLQQTDNLNIRDTTSQRDAAQSFIPSITAHINRVSLYIKKVGNPGNMDILVLPDNGDAPSNSGSIAYGVLQENNVTTNYGWVDVTLNSDEPLFQNQKYWIVFDNGANHASRYYVLGGATDTDYPSGTFLYSPNWDAALPIWTVPIQSARDATFKIFLGLPATYIKEMVVRGNAHANTLTNNKICGDAYYQYADAFTLNFLDNPTSCPEPLTPGVAFSNQLDPQPQNMPISQAQIDEFKAQADAGGTCVQPTCDALGNLERNGIGTTILSGPLKIQGNLILDNQASLIMGGNLHVVGNVHLKNTCRVELSSSYENLDGLIVVDGTVNIENQCALIGSGDPTSYIMVLTTNPELDILGAIHIKNSASGAIFYASEGSIFLENQTDLKEAVAQRLYLKNQATVTYETGLANMNFSSGPAGGYEVMRWKEIE